MSKGKKKPKTSCEHSNFISVSQIRNHTELQFSPLMRACAVNCAFLVHVPACEQSFIKTLLISSPRGKQSETGLCLHAFNYRADCCEFEQMRLHLNI